MLKGYVLVNTSSAFLTGTHDIQNVSVSSFDSEVRVTGDFIDGSTATGVLVIVYSLTDDSDIHYVSKSPEQNIKASVTGLTGSWYGVSVFVLEENRLPFSRTAASPKVVENNIQVQRGTSVCGVM